MTATSKCGRARCFPIPVPGKENVWQNYAANLMHWRGSRDKKIAEVARDFGVSTSTWGHWETGRSIPSGQNLVLVSEFTAIPIPCLLCPDCNECQT